MPKRLLLLLSISVCLHAQWNQFRGPNGSGVSAGAGYPVEFSPAKNVAWKTAIPYGQSSPVVAGGKVYLTASDGDQLITIAVDQKSGKQLWRKETKRAQRTEAYKANDAASPTPAADENGVVAFFADFGLVAYAPDGKQAWTYPLGPFKNFYGMSASPIVSNGLVIQLCDQLTGGFVVALDRKTGKLRWRVERPGMDIGWSTPIIFHSDVIVLGSKQVDSYEIATGKQNWFLPVASGGSMGTPVANGDTILVSTEGSAQPMLPTFASYLEKYDKDKDGRLSHEEFKADKDFGEHFGWLDTNGDEFIDAKEWETARMMNVGDFGTIAIQPGTSRGKLDKSAVVRWRFTKNLPYIPAPLVYQGVVYTVKDGAIVTAVDAKTGKLLKEGRSKDAIGEYYASPIAADGKVYIASTEGKISVLKAGPQWEVLSVNDMKEDVHATPALSDGRIYVRTHDALYCFGTI